MRTLVAGIFVAAAVAAGLLGALEARGQGDEPRINLLWPDDYARRSMKVMSKSGGELRGLRMIEAYDPNNKSLIMTTVTGEPRTIPAADLNKIEFSQHIISQPQYMQMAREEIQAHLGPVRTVKIPAQEFRVQNGYLEGPDLLAQFQSETTPQGNTLNLEDLESTKSVQEVRSIVYDPQADMFVVTIQPVRYVRQFLGGGGGVTEGGGKGIQ
jgi:hypothetical protein